MLNKFAIIALTRGGSGLARKIGKEYPGADLYLPKKFLKPGEKDACALSEDLASDMKKIFGKYKAIACIMAAGIVVRMIAPFIEDKKKDPAVVVMDEKGKFVISLLSGHLGGANELAEKLAGLTCGQAVITTASDVQNTLAVDMLAKSLDCAIEDFDCAKKVTAAIVNGEKVAAWSYIAPALYARRINKIPGNLRFYGSLEKVIKAKRTAALAVTPFVLPKEMERALNPISILRPKVLVVGIGCNRGTSRKEIEGLVTRTFREHGLSTLSVRNLATINEKKDERGINEFAKKAGLKVQYVSRRRLLNAATPSGPSETVFRNMGVYGVCEPAALISAGASMLLVPKKKSKNATVAVAEAPLA